MQLTGAQALVKSLEMSDVEVMFGLPGGAILPVYDPILDSKIRHVLVRHEQGAGHMAQGYAHVTGRPGVCIVTSGPAATNKQSGRRETTIQFASVVVMRFIASCNFCLKCQPIVMPGWPQRSSPSRPTVSARISNGK